LVSSFIQTSEIGLEDESPQELGSESATMPATQEGELCVSY
jgi:hypothetical protein